MLRRVGMAGLLVLVAVASASGHTCASKSADGKHSLVYHNRKYRFCFDLPEDWKGYSVIVGTWSGTAFNRDSEHGDPVGGPLITLRNPLWDKDDLRQDIPILILTHAQGEIWNDISVSAAPYGPVEIGRNAKYVFSIFPRFNESDGTGTEEVRELFRHHPLHAY